MLLVLLFIAAIFLAYTNGANDNFKGVATLYGSKTLNYREALTLTTIATFVGSVCSIFLAATLVANFSGKGLVPDGIAGSPEFLLSVASGAGVTVLLATLLGFPISTTHGLTGALVGAGYVAVGNEVNLSLLGNKFFLPLLISPLIAMLLGTLVYFTLNTFTSNPRSVFFRVNKKECVCVDSLENVVSPGMSDNILALQAISPQLTIILDTQVNCDERNVGRGARGQRSAVRLFEFNLPKLLDFAHCCSAAAVCFARGLNDTPKIVALLLAIPALDIKIGLLVIGVGMAIGGILNAKKVAETMSNKIAHLDHAQGFSANLVTGFLVIFASRLGMPVSTTHVSVGSIFGIGMLTKQADFSVMLKILASWLITLPVAAVIAGIVFWLQ